jgi:transketolase N-terminal domain/subunit
VLAVYAAPFLKGWLPEEALDTYCGEGSLLGVHPEQVLSPSPMAARWRAFGWDVHEVEVTT